MKGLAFFHGICLQEQLSLQLMLLIEAAEGPTSK